MDKKLETTLGFRVKGLEGMGKMKTITMGHNKDYKKDPFLHS